MKIVSTFHQPSSVVGSVKCQLTSLPDDYLVVAKLNSLDVYSVLPEGIQHCCKWEVWGNILAVKALPIPESSRSNLVVMLDHPEPALIFLIFNHGSLVRQSGLSLLERNQRPAEFFNDIIVHPSGKLAVASCYPGKLKVIVLEAGHYSRHFDVSLFELTIFSLDFLLSSDEYTLVILQQDHLKRVRLQARTILVDEEDIQNNELSTAMHPTPLSAKTLPYPEDAIPKLIAVPGTEIEANADETQSFIGGVLVVGGTRILLYEMASRRGQEKQKNKRRKLEKEKESGRTEEANKATQKERERDERKRKPKAYVDWPWSEVTAFCELGGHRYLVGDCFGRLSMLSLQNVPTHGLILIPLGEISPPTTLSYITNQILYVGSHAGDSQLVQISATPLSSSDETPTLPIPREIQTVAPGSIAPSWAKGKGKEDALDPVRDCVLDVKGSYVRVIQSFKNIAPILDAALVDTDNSGHQQIVTCSGGQNTGSINVVRNGADFKQLATIAGMPHTVGVFPLRRTSSDDYDSHVLVSTLTDSQIFELSHSGATMSSPGTLSDFARGRTLAALNIRTTKTIKAVRQGNKILSPERKMYVDSPFDSFDVASKWDKLSNGRRLEVVAASVNRTQAILAMSGGWLACLEAPDGKVFAVTRDSKSLSSYREISAVSCTPLNPNSNDSEFVAVSYWETNTIEILRQVDNKFELFCKTAPLDVLVRSLLLYNLGSEEKGDVHPYLFAGLANGSFVSFPWNGEILGAPKLTSLGNAPVSLTPCNVDGRIALFAAGSRAMMLSWERDRIHNSPVMLKEVMAAAQIHHEKYSSSFILANEVALFIGQVRDLNKMHIRSIPLGLDAPQRIAYDPLLKLFGVACTRREPARIGAAEPPLRSSFRLLDDTTFSHLSQYNCEPDEEITCLATLTLKRDEESTSYFCLGTYTVDFSEKIPTEGRLLVFSAYPPGAHARSSNVQLSLLASADVRGCVYSVATVNGLIAAGVNSAVMLFRLDVDPTSKRCTLHMVSTLNIHYFVTSMVSFENRLVIGDQISSVSLLEVSKDAKLRSLGRDLTPLSPVSVEALDRTNIIAGSDTLNLVSFEFDEENKKLDRNGFYQQSDLITKFVRGSITTPDAGSKLKPVHIFFASSGRIGVITDVEEPLSLALTELQRNMASVLKRDHPVDDHTHSFRKPQTTARSRNQESAVGFLDGDFLEQLLTVSDAQLTKIIAGTNEAERLKMPLEDIQQVLKNLQALH
ncbi:CPSF A subunit region-domain-containing protein [Mycena rebaudengoi]|nr:CPSF A subunit region-domain-containing protein [Mycena rebaudengoi]